MTERTFDLSGSSHSNLQALEAKINNALKLGFFLDSEKKKSLFRVILLFLFVSLHYIYWKECHKFDHYINFE